MHGQPHIKLGEGSWVGDVAEENNMWRHINKQQWWLKCSSGRTAGELDRQIKRVLGHIRRNNDKVGVTMCLF